MCGRYYLDLDFERLLSLYDFVENLESEDFRTGEIFPSQDILVVKPNRFEIMRWGMKYDFMKKELINGRVETIREKRLFKEAFQQRRIIIPANAYFEWEKDGSKKIKRRIEIKNQEVISMAGIYNVLRIGDRLVDSAVILTQSASEGIRQVHERMPLFIPEGMEKEWLNTDNPELLIDEIRSKNAICFNVE